MHDLSTLSNPVACLQCCQHFRKIPLYVSTGLVAQ